jgi:hypothetical protein
MPNGTRRSVLKVFEDITIRPISWLKAGVYTVALALVYYSALVQMVFSDSLFSIFSGRNAAR